MELIDTHCHLYLPDFENDLDQVVLRAKEAGVSRFYMPAIDQGETNRLLQTEARFPGVCLAMMGLHPCSVKDNYEEELQIVGEWFSKRAFAGVGEIGLDHYWERKYDKQQEEAFEKQIELAINYKRPVVIHSREAMDECIEMISGYKNKVGGIFHCFGGTGEQARKIIDLGMYLGIGGVLTYKKSGLAEVLKEIPLDNIVLETDAPYLSPVPYRGKRNESAYLLEVAKNLAVVKNISLEEVAVITTENAKRVFGE